MSQIDKEKLLEELLSEQSYIKDQITSVENDLYDSRGRLSILEKYILMIEKGMLDVT